MSGVAIDEAISEADRYLKEVTPHLAALPADERADLLEDLALHLQEVAAEPGPPLEERLGPPAAYAAELLASAGVTLGPVTKARPWSRVTAVAARVRRSAAGREVVRMWPSLRPAWWVIRAFVAVYLVTDLTQDRSPLDSFPVPALFGNPLVGLLALGLAASASIRLGQHRLTGVRRAAVVAANVVVVFYGLALASQLQATEVRYVDSSGADRSVSDLCLRNGDGSIITNLYGYDQDGRLLDPVLLYDQFGRPVDNLCAGFDGQGRRLATEYRRDANGAPVVNAFPRKQGASVPGGPRLGRPTQPDPTVPISPPAVVVPRLGPSTTAPTATTVP